MKKGQSMKEEEEGKKKRLEKGREKGRLRGG